MPLPEPGIPGVFSFVFWSYYSGLLAWASHFYGSYSPGTPRSKVDIRTMNLRTSGSLLTP